MTRPPPPPAAPPPCPAQSATLPPTLCPPPLRSPPGSAGWPAMDEASPIPTTHHRPLPASAAPAPSATVSLRPHRIPPPPPAVVPAGFSPRVVLLLPDPPRPKLYSVVIGDLVSMAAGLVVSEAQLEMPLSASGVEDDGPAWQVVRGKKRLPRNLPPPSPPRGREERVTAFRRRVRGCCFRCLEPGHRVAGCVGDIRCLACRCSGHRERDCELGKKNCHAPPASLMPASGTRRPLDRSWAAVAAPLPKLGDLGSPSRARPTAISASATLEMDCPAPACPAAPSDMLHILEEQAALLRAEQEQAKLMRAELRGLVASHLEIGRAHV